MFLIGSTFFSTLAILFINLINIEKDILNLFSTIASCMLEHNRLPQLAIVVPCFNESEVLPETGRRMCQLLEDMISKSILASNSYILFVDDGSKDDTWQLIEALHQKSTSIKGLKLSRNFGHQNALLGGLHHAQSADIIISIDADLQDDLDAIPQMVSAYKNGAAIVYGIRNDRTSDSFFKRKTAQTFYKILKAMGVESVYNHADYRLMSQQALQAFLAFPEQNLYLRGLIPLVGFPSAEVLYTRTERFAGSSKYGLYKMLSLAWNAVSSLSIKPLRFVTFLGFFFFFISILMSVYALHSYITKDSVAGWTSIVLPMYFLGGIQLLCIGLIGEYVAKLYKEVKQRPRFIIEKATA